MKIIFDNEKQKDRFFEMIVRSDYCPESAPLFELHNHAKCPGNDFDEECSCKECWENSGIEIAGEDTDEPSINQEDIVNYIHAMSNMDKTVIEIILGLEMDYLKLNGIAEEKE